MKRATPLSMKRLHILVAQWLITLGVKEETAAQAPMLNFLKYVWEHKDDELMPLPGSRWDKSAHK
jgi:hypothetical protein